MQQKKQIPVLCCLSLFPLQQSCCSNGQHGQATWYYFNLRILHWKKHNEICYSKYCSYICEHIQDMEEKKDYTVTQEQLARFAKALGHPARVAIMHFLAKQKTCYFGDIHEELPIAKATVSQHLKELKDAGLIQGEVETPKVKYCINRENWQLACELFKEFFGQCICKSGECCW